MNYDDMKLKADSFFEFPTENRDHVTTTSTILFALEMYKLSREETAREIIQYIVDQGKLSVPRTGDDVYFVVDDDLKVLRAKYGVKI